MTMHGSRRGVRVGLFALVGAGAACAFAGCGGGSRSSGFGDEGSGAGVDASDATSPGSAGDASIGFPGSDATLGPGPRTDAAVEGGSYSDTTPDVQTPDGACTRGDAGPAPLRQRCAAPTTNECVGTDAQLTSLGVPAALLNGANGNGFDDDCDGLVDEGCACPSSGTTKDCFLVPPTMVDVTVRRPVGWCADNSKGSLDCAGGEFPHWSGTCRGAQPPYAHDVCASGDFNCDGLPQNSDVQDCTCHVAEVTCPTAPLTLAPYPDPKSIKPIDGNAWIGGGKASLATGWKWTVVGGDCDNILPHPTFALYKQADATVPSARVGVRTPVKFSPTSTPPEYLATPGAPLMSIQAATGNGTTAGTVYPAFGLSGDYVVQGEFDLDAKHYVCTQKVQVRAPGIRAELCWDTVGNVTTGTSGGANDVDLHLARLQGITCASKGWDSTCTQGTPTTYEDCWWSSVSGCRDFSTRGPGWGYADSADSACIGWSSKRHVKGGATSQFPQGVHEPQARSRQHHVRSRHRRPQLGGRRRVRQRRLLRAGERQPRQPERGGRLRGRREPLREPPGLRERQGAREHLLRRRARGVDRLRSGRGPRGGLPGLDARRRRHHRRRLVGGDGDVEPAERGGLRRGHGAFALSGRDEGRREQQERMRRLHADGGPRALQEPQVRRGDRRASGRRGGVLQALKRDLHPRRARSTMCGARWSAKA